MEIPPKKRLEDYPSQVARIRECADQVMMMIAEGKPRYEIAEKIGVTTTSLSTYMHHLRKSQFKAPLRSKGIFSADPEKILQKLEEKSRRRERFLWKQSKSFTNDVAKVLAMKELRQADESLLNSANKLGVVKDQSNEITAIISLTQATARTVDISGGAGDNVIDVDADDVRDKPPTAP